jgi:hypothetical protein
VVRETERLCRLPDRWLAEELLRLARAARAAFPAQLGSPNAMSYAPMLVWNVIPEVARRLGATRLNQQEAARCNIHGQSDGELRLTVASHLANARLGSLPMGANALSPAEILGHDISKGNPVAMAADRIGTASRLGVRQQLPCTTGYRSLAQISAQSRNRRCRCRQRSGLAAGDRHRGASSASAATCSSGGSPGNWRSLR